MGYMYKQMMSMVNNRKIQEGYQKDKEYLAWLKDLKEIGSPDEQTTKKEK